MKLEQKDILDYNKFYREIADLEVLRLLLYIKVPISPIE